MTLPMEVEPRDRRRFSPPHSAAAPSSTAELIAVFLTGVGHVTLELVSGLFGVGRGVLARPQQVYNLAAVLLWAVYLVWRVARTRGVLVDWGFRRDSLGAALAPTAAFALVAAVPVLVYGALRHRLPLPVTFWLVFALYPLWGLAQQFALQVLITRNLRGVVPRLPFRVLAASALFSASHFPNYPLMALTFLAGLGFTWLYERHRNLWAVGLAHGILGALAYYLVLGEDPGSEMLGMLQR
ncbi:MAG: CPBP family intramembrane metalloprotease [Kiritimatiellae bacterium]|nr:CPBP family intramembrane metalloprotease [Kiritimatiellia bacterium]